MEVSTTTVSVCGTVYRTVVRQALGMTYITSKQLPNELSTVELEGRLPP